MNIHVLCVNCQSFRKTKYSSVFSEDTNLSFSKCGASVPVVEKALKKAVSTWRKTDFILIDNALGRNSEKSFRKLFAGILYRYEKTIQPDPRKKAKEIKKEIWRRRLRLNKAIAETEENAVEAGENPQISSQEVPDKNNEINRTIDYDKKTTHIFTVELNELKGYTFVYGERKIIVLPKGLKSEDIPAFTKKALSLYEQNSEDFPEGYSLKHETLKVLNLREKYIPSRKDNARENVRKCVQLSAIAAFLIAGIMLLYNVYYLPMENDRIQSEIRTIFYQTETDPVTGEVIKTRNWSKLKKINSDIVGWVKLDNTRIDYPILQHEGDNPKSQYYLYRNYKKQSSGFGSIYLDYRSKKGLKSKNAILHGHHMDDGSMFSDLMKYGLTTGDLNFYKKTPTVEISTEKGGTETYKIFAVFKSNVNPEQGEFFDFYCGEFESDAQFMNYVYNLRIRSLINTPVTVNEKDKLLTLVTCSYEFDDFRTVVVARKCRKGESEEVDVSKASIPPTSLWPQIYYSRYGRTRPAVSTFKTEYQKGNINWYDGSFDLEGTEELPVSVIINYTVKIYNRGALIKTQQVAQGTGIELPTIPKKYKDGKYEYIFIGWSYKGSKNNELIIGDTTITAVYTKVKIKEKPKETTPKETKPKETKPAKPKPTKPKPTKAPTTATQTSTEKPTTPTTVPTTTEPSEETEESE